MFLRFIKIEKGWERVGISQRHMELDNLVFCLCFIFVALLTQAIIFIKAPSKAISHVDIRKTKKRCKMGKTSQTWRVTYI